MTGRERRKIVNDLAASYNKEDRVVEYNIKFAKDVVDKFPFSYFSILRGRRFAKFWQCVVDNTVFLDDVYAKNDITRLYYFINKIDKQICCSTCGKPKIDKIPALTKWPMNFHCCNRCAQKDPTILRKVKSTKEKNCTTTKDLLERRKKYNQEHFGVDWYFQTDVCKKKMKKTWLKHGYNHPMHSDKIKEQMAERYFEKHGVRCPFQNPEVQHKCTRKYKYNGINFDSAPEIAYFIWLADNNIDFEYKPKQVFFYTYNGKEHFYMPDFKVEDQFVEIKGDQFFAEDGKMKSPYNEKNNAHNEAKHQCMLANNVKILRTNDYMQFMKYVEDKYGKDYLKQFKNRDYEVSEEEDEEE